MKMNDALSVEKAFAPVKELNDIALDYTTKVVDINLGAMRKHADAMLAGWRDALAIRDPEGLKSYISLQSEVAVKLVDELAADTKMVQEYGIQAAESARELVAKSIPLEGFKLD